MTIFLEGCSKAELNALERAYLNERSQATDENLNLVPSHGVRAGTEFKFDHDNFVKESLWSVSTLGARIPHACVEPLNSLRYHVDEQHDDHFFRRLLKS